MADSKIMESRRPAPFPPGDPSPFGDGPPTGSASPAGPLGGPPLESHPTETGPSRLPGEAHPGRQGAAGGPALAPRPIDRQPWSVLICDHRAGGLAERSSEIALRSSDYWVSRSLRHSLELIAEQRPDVLLVDPLAGVSHTELLALGRAGRKEGGVPLLVVSEARSAPKSQLVALAEARTEARAEGFDSVERGAPLEELRLRLERLVDDHRLRVELQELRYRASHDDHTGCLRPAAFQERLSEHFSAAGRHRLHLALVLLDLDKFGQVNKVHDHTVGDDVIRRVGAAVRSTLRTEDLAGRLGGDEFAVVLPYTRPKDAIGVVDRLRDRIHRLSGPVPGRGIELDVSGSLGFETYDGADLPSVGKLREHAERALRQAKAAGGNRSYYYRDLG